MYFRVEIKIERYTIFSLEEQMEREETYVSHRTVPIDQLWKGRLCAVIVIEALFEEQEEAQRRILRRLLCDAHLSG